MAQGHWTLENINWDAFRADRVTPNFLAIAKTASLVEHNGLHYADYLYKVFPDNPELKEAITEWAREEVQHGVALGKWAEMADPSFNFKAAFAQFSNEYKLPLDAEGSVRGSQAGELIARCIVETGTSSFYTAIADTCEEPVLQQIARKIAADEHRHYKLFYTYMKPYQEQEKLSKLSRLKIVIDRIKESSDDELCMAYHIANKVAGTYDKKKAEKAYSELTTPLFQPQIVRKVVTMALKPTGFNPQGLLSHLFIFMFRTWLQFKQRPNEQKVTS